jgi:DNA-binding GntR family transcriptional regulator
MHRPIPAYLAIAARLRADIASGVLMPGQRLPSESQLMRKHGVSRSVGKWAFALLKADGWVEGRQGAGVFVKVFRRVARHPHALDTGRGRLWAEHIERIAAPPHICARLALSPGVTVEHIHGRYLPAGGPLQLVHVWRAVDYPHDLAVDRFQERVVFRPATPEELRRLRATGGMKGVGVDEP